MSGTAIICCGDRRLNFLVQVLDQNGCYRIRDIGSPFDFVIDQSQLLVLHSKLVGFPPENAPIRHVLVLTPTALRYSQVAFSKLLVTNEPADMQQPTKEIWNSVRNNSKKSKPKPQGYQGYLVRSIFRGISESSKPRKPHCSIANVGSVML